MRNAEPRPTVVLRTLRPFESAWCVVQKLAGFNHVRPSEMARQVWTRTRFGRGTTVVFQPRGLAALLGLTALEAEAFGPEHLLNRMSLSRLQVVRCDTVRYCPECLRTGYHSELFQLRAVQNCPEHGIALREVCPNCQTSIVPDARTHGAFTCAYCTAQVSNWSPQLDGILALERFPALEALGQALREHAGSRGYAQRTFVLGPRPYKSPQRTLLALWTSSDPDRIRVFVPKLRRARWRGDERATAWPVELRPIYFAVTNALKRRTARHGRADALAAAFDRWRRLWEATRGAGQMLAPLAGRSAEHEGRLWQNFWMFTHALSEFDVDFESCLRHVFVELLLATLREVWRQETRNAPVEDLAELTSFPIVLAHAYQSATWTVYE